MAITKQRIKKIEQALNVGETKKPPRIIIIENPEDNLDEKTKRAYIDYKIKQLEKEEGYGFLPIQIIMVDKDEVEKVRQRIKEKIV